MSHVIVIQEAVRIEGELVLTADKMRRRVATLNADGLPSPYSKLKFRQTKRDILAARTRGLTPRTMRGPLYGRKKTCHVRILELDFSARQKGHPRPRYRRRFEELALRTGPEMLVLVATPQIIRSAQSAQGRSCTSVSLWRSILRRGVALLVGEKRRRKPRDALEQVTCSTELTRGHR
jgi:hypothetical protein